MRSLLPMAVYAEFLMFIEASMLASFFIYTACISNYIPIAFVFGVQVLADSKRRFHLNLVLLAPATWLVFYVMDLIEQALL